MIHFLDVFDLVPQEDRTKVQGAVSLTRWSLPEGYIKRPDNLCRFTAVRIIDGADAVTELALAIAEACRTCN